MANAQRENEGVVSLAYDGGLTDHREGVIPILDRLGLLGTFAMPPEALLEAPITWRAAAERGHEIAVHSLYGVTIDGALENWTREMVHGDLEMARRLATELVGQDPVGFVYPGRETWCADGDYASVVRDIFQVARTGEEGLNEPDHDPLALRQISTFGLTGAQLICQVEEAVSTGRWIILSFEGVGTGERGCDAAAHAELCFWLSKARDILTVAPVAQVANRLINTPVAPA